MCSVVEKRSHLERVLEFEAIVLELFCCWLGLKSTISQHHVVVSDFNGCWPKEQK